MCLNQYIPTGIYLSNFGNAIIQPMYSLSYSLLRSFDWLGELNPRVLFNRIRSRVYLQVSNMKYSTPTFEFHGEKETKLQFESGFSTCTQLLTDNLRDRFLIPVFGYCTTVLDDCSL